MESVGLSSVRRRLGGALEFSRCPYSLVNRHPRSPSPSTAKSLFRFLDD
ncbi:hypothetical protein CCACVL1_14944 [Corchorus capsularis]|uniref:Uncharacterized protein n=1 Tax=Corchorus capsularis TaxID=210143 RepID=A0A1R3I4S2_COCAP|nr:hypothetical protein CCACVL1_14944 [Corchorus capsularis]